MKKQFTVLVLALILAGCSAVEGQASQFDFSAIDPFWAVEAELSADREPSASQWSALFDTPGYKALTHSEFSTDFFRRHFELAYLPSRTDEREEALAGRTGRFIRHYLQVAEDREQLEQHIVKLKSTSTFAGIISQADAYLPSSLVNGSPDVAFVIFDNDARAYEPIVVDLQSSRDRDFESFLAHEFHHWYRNRALLVDLEAVATEDYDLIWTLNQIQAEGIADQIDKRSWITGETEVPPSKAAYAGRYMEHLEATPALLKTLDALLVSYSEAGSDRSLIGAEIRELVPQSGHPTGYFMASLILEHLGREALVQNVTNPFAFFRAFDQATANANLADLRFSPAAIGLLDDLEQQYAKDRALSNRKELNDLVTREERDFLFREIKRIDPPERIKELAGYHQRQSDQGGGFFGMLPAQLDNVSLLPVPSNEADILEAALILARQRKTNIDALAAADPEYVFTFTGNSTPDWTEKTPRGMSLHLDISAIHGFLDALEDGTVTLEEASALVALPANREMLRHRASLSYMPEPYVTPKTLETMIVRAGASDPLDRLWNWVHPMNNFGYADLAAKRDKYSAFMSQMTRHGDRLAAKALSSIAEYAPVGIECHETFAFTVGFFIRGWATRKMAGLNIEQVKDDWDRILGTVTEETYHRLQLSMVPASDGQQAHDYEQLAAADLGDERYEKFYELLTYTMLEGSANRARGDDIPEQLPRNVDAGARLVSEFVSTVVEGKEISAADELIVAGLRSNGPLYSLGWHLAGLIADADGTHAVGEWQQRGPVAFMLHAQEISVAAGKPVLGPGVVTAIRELEELLTPVDLKDVSQPVEFVGWWEVVSYVRDGEPRQIEGLIERIHPDARFEVFRNGERVGGGRHVEFRTDPQGFTNVHEIENPFGIGGRELVIYRIEGDCLEVCKAPEELGRPTEFRSTAGSSIVHAVIRRISDDDPRIP